MACEALGVVGTARRHVRKCVVGKGHFLKGKRSKRIFREFAKKKRVLV